MTTPTPAVYIGLDVGKSDHHAVALTTAGERVYDKALPNDETRLRAILDDLAAAHGPVLLVVDQPATIGARYLFGGAWIVQDEQVPASRSSA